MREKTTSQLFALNMECISLIYPPCEVALVRLLVTSGFGFFIAKIFFVGGNGLDRCMLIFPSYDHFLSISGH